MRRWVHCIFDLTAPNRLQTATVSVRMSPTEILWHASCPFCIFTFVCYAQIQNLLDMFYIFLVSSAATELCVKFVLDDSKCIRIDKMRPNVFDDIHLESSIFRCGLSSLTVLSHFEIDWLIRMDEMATHSFHARSHHMIRLPSDTWLYAVWWEFHPVGESFTRWQRHIITRSKSILDELSKPLARQSIQHAEQIQSMKREWKKKNNVQLIFTAQLMIVSNLPNDK